MTTKQIAPNAAELLARRTALEAQYDSERKALDADMKAAGISSTRITSRTKAVATLTSSAAALRDRIEGTIAEGLYVERIALDVWFDVRGTMTITRAHVKVTNPNAKHRTVSKEQIEKMQEARKANIAAKAAANADAAAKATETKGSRKRTRKS